MLRSRHSGYILSHRLAGRVARGRAVTPALETSAEHARMEPRNVAATPQHTGERTAKGPREVISER